MKEFVIEEIEQKMQAVLDNCQRKRFKDILINCLSGYDLVENNDKKDEEIAYIDLFIGAKKVEGRSDKTLDYYRKRIENMVSDISKQINHITTEDLRLYLAKYQETNKSSKVTIDNIRRILSSFFGWLEDEDYIIKSPVRRIHKVKTTKSIKETYTDEELESMRDNCDNLRDLALIDIL